jgi:threonine dehydrogenase-like Zn-dependent dehydrogenase
VHLGHEAVAEVLAVGSDVRTVRPGDRVVVAFQISCGECDRCRRGLTGSCQAVAGTAMYGLGSLGGTQWGGMLADIARVPYADAMCVPVPEDLDSAAVASVADNVPDGWRTVAPALRAAGEPGELDVRVVGGGAKSVGLYAAGVAVALGARRVDYLDRDPRRLAVASDLGANAIEVAELPQRPDRRYPVTVDAGSTAESVVFAVRATEFGGTCTSVGIVWDPMTPMPLFDMYITGITFHIGRAMVRPARPAVLDLIAGGRLRPEAVTDEVVAWDEAPSAVLEPRTKLVLTR